MHGTQVLINALESHNCTVRQYGDRYRSQCPVHGSKGGTLIVQTTPEGKTNFHCFAGCQGVDILDSLGLRWGDVLGERDRDWTPKPKPRPKPLWKDPVGALNQMTELIYSEESDGIFVGHCPLCEGYVSAGPGGISCSTSDCPIESAAMTASDLNDARRIRMNKRTIEVLGLTELKRGEKNGRPWIMSKVHANDENGQPITQNLKTFEELPQGRLELFFKREEYQGETSFMVSTYEPKPRFENQAAMTSAEAKQINDKLDQLIAMSKPQGNAQTSDLQF